MANPNTLGITIAIDDSQATKALLSMQGTLDDLNKKHQNNNNNNQQAVSNLVDGLSFVKGAMDSLITSVGNFGEATRIAFVEAESALTDINITIGRTGNMMRELTAPKDKKLLARELGSEFDAIEEKVAELARNTEFSYTEIAKLFRTLKQSGLDTATVMNRIKLDDGSFSDKSILEATLAFSSASRGALDLDQAAKTLILSSNSLNTGLGGIEKNADRMIRMVNNADVAFGDLSIMMESLSGAGKGLFSESGPEQIITLLAALKTAGKSPAQAGQYIVGFGRSLNNLAADFLKKEEYLQGKKSYFARRSKDKGFKAPQQRRAVKMFALARLGLKKDTFLNEQTGQLRPLLEIMKSLRLAADKVTKDKQAFEDISGRQIEPGRVLGKAEALALIYKSLGTQEATQLVQATEMLEARLKQAGRTKSSMFDFAENIDTTANDAMRAQETALSDNRGATKLLESALFSLNQQLGKTTGGFDTFSKIASKNVISAMDSLLRKSEGLNGMIGTMIIGLKVLAGVLGAAAGTILTLGMLGQVQAGYSLAVADATAKLVKAGTLANGATATMSQTIGSYLGNIMTFVGPLAMAIVLIATLSGVFFKMSTESEKFFGWFAPAISSLGDGFENFFKYYLPTLLGKTIFNDKKFKQDTKAVSKSTKDMMGRLSILSKLLQEFAGGAFTAMAGTFDILISTILLPLYGVFQLVAFGVSQFLDAYTLLINFFRRNFGFVEEEATAMKDLEKRLNDTSYATTALGYVVGILAGFYLTYATILAVNKAVTLAYTAVTKGLLIVKNAFIGMLTLEAKKTAIVTWWQVFQTKVTGALSVASAALTATFFMQFLAVFLLVGIIVGLIYYMSTAEEGSWGMKVAFGMLIVASIIMIVLLAKMAMALLGIGTAGALASAGLFPIIAVVVAVVTVVGLLAYGIYKLLQFMGVIGKSGNKMGNGFKNLGKQAKEAAAGTVIKGKDGEKKKLDVDKVINMNTAGPKKVKLSGNSALPTGGLLKKVKIPGLSDGKIKLPDSIDAESLGKGATVPSGGANVTNNFMLSTNVQQIDGNTANKLAKQFAPLIIKEVQKSMA